MKMNIGKILMSFGVFFLCIGLIFLTSQNNSQSNIILSGILFLSIGGIIIFIGYKAIKKVKDKRFAEEQEDKRNYQLAQDKIIESKLAKVEQLALQLSEIQKIKIIDISDFKKTIIDNENLIISKGGDNQLLSFMKLDSFLQEFRERIVNDQNGIVDGLEIKWLKSRIIEESKRKDLEKIIENLEDVSASLNGKKTKGFDSNIEKLFDLGNIMNPVMENQIKTIEYYRNMAVAMIIFYLNDKKIRYFEIYEAFEKLGVFDSSWQKNVLKKLDNIETRLAQMSNQLTELNQNFISLVESSENITSELKEINNSIMTNNMLQAITAYQTWRINKNTKSLKN